MSLVERFLGLSRKLDDEERMVAQAMGLPGELKNWTPQVIEGIYKTWESAELEGKSSATMIEEDAKRAGVSFQAAHRVHCAVAAVNMLQQKDLSKKQKPSV